MKRVSSNSEKNINALSDVGISVDYAVERFVQVGKNIANENQNIKYDMLVACFDAKESGKLFYFSIMNKLNIK